MGDVLIVIDMQKDFINGSLGTKEAEAIVDNVKKKVAEYKSQGKKVFFTRDTHQENYLDTFEGKNLPVVHCVKGTAGWEICDELRNEAVHNQIIDKPTFGFLNWSDVLPNSINGIGVCGLCTDICVVSNVLILRATYPELPITVDSKCCAGVTPEKHEAALEVMRSCQIEIV